ncbi:MAG: histidinol-phosphate transaminase [Lachnospiraceae bacterium]|nr:histidinol-phosphate transaminase [Lachnospiraceae bacterium]
MDWRENVRMVTPYVAGEQPKISDIIKLNTNESPYPPSPKVGAGMASLDAGLLRLYPDPNCTVLVDALADYYGLTPEQVFVGVGSDDVLALAYLTFFNSKKPLLFPDVSYSFYDVWAELYRIPYQTVPLDDDFGINQEDYLRDNGGIIFPNPNAPTGVFENLDLVEYIVKNNSDSIVIIDEAYIDFGGVSALKLIDKYSNLLVVQTFSKSRAMAGIRIGYAMGNPELIKYLSDAKFSFNSYTMNLTSLTLGGLAVLDDAYFKEITAKIINTREWFGKELTRLGFSYPKSCANFIFATHPEIKAAELFLKLKESGIYVRYFNQPRIDNYLRITIGTDEEMRKVVEFLNKYNV